MSTLSADNRQAMLTNHGNGWHKSDANGPTDDCPLCQERTLVDRDIAANWPAAIRTDVYRGHDVAVSWFWFDYASVLGTWPDGHPVTRERWNVIYNLDGQIVRARRMDGDTFQTIEVWEAET